LQALPPHVAPPARQRTTLYASPAADGAAAIFRDRSAPERSVLAMVD
jgi:hypothetical protein